MQAARVLEGGLLETVGEIGDQRAGHRGAVRQWRAVHGDLLERSLAAHSARRRRVEAPLTGLVCERTLDLDRVGREDLRWTGIPRPVDQALAVQESQRELLVVTRRAHRHRERAAVDPDLQRLLDGDRIGRPVVLDLDVRARHPGKRYARGVDRPRSSTSTRRA